MGLFESKAKKAARYYAQSFRHDGCELENLQKAVSLGSSPAKEGLAKYYHEFYKSNKEMQQKAMVLMEEADREGVNVNREIYAKICEGCGEITRADEQWGKAMKASLSIEAQLEYAYFLMRWHKTEREKLLVAEEMLCRAYEDGRHVSFQWLAELYENLAIYPRAFAMYHMAALDGSSTCQYITGLYYLEGKGVEKDLFEAAHWMKRAADENNRDAQFMLAKMYLHGIGTDKHVGEAISILEKLAGYYYTPAIEYFAEYYYEKGTDDQQAEKYARIGKNSGSKKCELIDALLNVYERVENSRYYSGLSTLEQFAEEGYELAVKELEKWKKYHEETTVVLFERGLAENNEELIREAAKHRYPEAARYLLKKIRERVEKNPDQFNSEDAFYAKKLFYICVSEKAELPMEDFETLIPYIGKAAVVLIKNNCYSNALDLVDSKYFNNNFLCLYAKALAYGYKHLSSELALNYYLQACRHPDVNEEKNEDYKHNLLFDWQLHLLSMGENWLKNSDKANYYMQEVKKAIEKK